MRKEKQRCQTVGYKYDKLSTIDQGKAKSRIISDTPLHNEDACLFMNNPEQCFYCLDVLRFQPMQNVGPRIIYCSFVYVLPIPF